MANWPQSQQTACLKSYFICAEYLLGIIFLNVLQKHQTHDIFVDLPIHRTKPPNNKYSLDDIIPIFKLNPNVKYLAISNVESSNDLKKYLDVFRKFIIKRLLITKYSLQ